MTLNTPVTSSFSPFEQVDHRKKFLPLVESKVHATILSTSSRTVLRQIYTNSTSENIEGCVYAFPLYENIGVVGFTCKIGTKTLTGLVKERLEAKRMFDDAVAKGETAGYVFFFIHF